VPPRVELPGRDHLVVDPAGGKGALHQLLHPLP
jgi:hypothetical protein